MFILFAEDKQLLPPNSIGVILEDWKDLREKYDEYFPLYDRFKKYFGYLNDGYKGKKHDVFAYNGGLFLPDEVLDNIKIDDELLSKHIKTLSNYDFASEVSVNILGHIFEHSLTEIENIQAQLAGEEIDKSKTKRKKDGVFYTPKYITKYIVDNTIGRLCEEKKQELEILDENYEQQKGRRQTTIDALREKLDKYRGWLLLLTICDPACGSGAFLNQALEFLIDEHRYLDALYQKLEGFSLPLTDIENSILENNLFGVDINEESIEIAKLSLWLRTAQKGRKLTTLNDNIKCGNSLIDDPEVAGEKAFDWKKEFPKVFANGGFDVVVGNPPYGAKLSKAIQKYLNEKYIRGGSETVISFSKMSYDLLAKPKGRFGFIIPKAFTYSSNYKQIRQCLLNDISEIIDCKKVWNEVKLEQIMLFFIKNHSTNHYKSGKLQNKGVTIVGDIDKSNVERFGFFLNDISNDELKIALKLKSHDYNLNDFAKNSRGAALQQFMSEIGNISVLGGAEIQRNGIVGIKGKIEKDSIKSDDKAYIKKNSILVQNIVAHIENPVDHIKITACFPQNRDYVIVDTINQLTFRLPHNCKTFWSLLNSNLMNWYCYRFIFAKAIRTMHFDNAVTLRIPIPKEIKEKAFLEKADQMLTLNEQLNEKISIFLSYIQSKYTLEKFSKKLQSWHELEFGEFIKEIAKAIKKTDGKQLTKSDEMEWMELFEAKKAEAQVLKIEIVETDRKIDQMVYELYGLTEEEIAIVEGSES